MRSSRTPLWAGVFLSGFVIGCGTPVKDETAQRKVMHDLATIVMLPILQDTDERAAELSTAVTAFCEAPSESTLSAAQDAFRALRKPWKRTEAFRFGPSEDLRLASALDFWPARVDSIESAITGAPEPVTVEHVEGLGTSARGMPALEYLIFDPIGGNAAVLASIGGADATALHRCGYARVLGELIAKNATELVTAWEPDGGGFVNEVATAGTGSKLFPTGQEGIGRVVNMLVSSTIAMNENKLSAPLGIATGTPDPTLAESRFSDNSNEDLLDALRGVEEIYLGQHGDQSGDGISSLVSARSTAIDQSVKTSLKDAIALASAIKSPIRLAVVDDQAPLLATREGIKTARRFIVTDVASVLGVSVTLSDNDGD